MNESQHTEHNTTTQPVIGETLTYTKTNWNTLRFTVVNQFINIESVHCSESVY